MPNRQYTNVYITLTPKHDFIPLLNKTLVTLQCHKEDLLGLIKELETVKRYCNGVANKNGLSLRQCNIKIELV